MQGVGNVAMSLPCCLVLCCSSQNERAVINDEKYFAADSRHC